MPCYNFSEYKKMLKVISCIANLIKPKTSQIQNTHSNMINQHPKQHKHKKNQSPKRKGKNLMKTSIISNLKTSYL